MKTAIRTYALADTNITDLIVARWYSFPAPQNATMPYVLSTRISEIPGRNLVAPDELYKELWQFDCYADSYASAETLKIAVRNRFDKCIPFTMGNFTILNMFCDSSDDLSELELSGGQAGIYRHQMDFTVIREKTRNP